MANDVQVLDGFRYEIEHATLWNSDRGVEIPCVIVKYIDDAREVELHAYFSREAWELFRGDVNGGVFVPSRDAIEKLGI